MRNLKIHNNQSGFTLIEMITTIAIMALILSLTIANIHGSDSSRSVLLVQSDLTSDLHTMQTYALNSKDFTPGVTHASAWGATFSSPYTSYTLQTFDNSLTPVTQNLSTISLPAKTSFTNITIDRSNGAGTVCVRSVTLQFSVPYSRILMTYTGVPCSGGSSLNVSQEPNDILTILIGYTGSSSLQHVTVNGISGNIVTQ